MGGWGHLGKWGVWEVPDSPLESARLATPCQEHLHLPELNLGVPGLPFQPASLSELIWRGLSGTARRRPPTPKIHRFAKIESEGLGLQPALVHPGTSPVPTRRTRLQQGASWCGVASAAESGLGRPKLVHNAERGCQELSLTWPGSLKALSEAASPSEPASSDLPLYSAAPPFHPTPPRARADDLMNTHFSQGLGDAEMCQLGGVVTNHGDPGAS